MSWGTEAETFGNLITLASGVFTNLPSSARSSETRCASVNRSGNNDKMRPAKEMSRVSTSMSAADANDWMIGKSE